MKRAHSGLAGVYLVLLMILILMGGLIGADLAYIEYSTRCGDKPISECVKATPTPTPEPENSVTARGTFSKKDYSANLEVLIPLGGGPISGKFSGDCNGVINGSFDGNEKGTISGTGRGSCKALGLPVPASGTFSGTVNKEEGVVLLNGTGSAAGFSGSGSLMLNF